VAERIGHRGNPAGAAVVALGRAEPY
jgi:hypothetical protein